MFSKACRGHPWVMNGYTQKPLSSIPTVIKERVVTTVDESVLEQLENLGFEREKVVEVISLFCIVLMELGPQTKEHTVTSLCTLSTDDVP